MCTNSGGSAEQKVAALASAGAVTVDDVMAQCCMARAAAQDVLARVQVPERHVGYTVVPSAGGAAKGLSISIRVGKGVAGSQLAAVLPSGEATTVPPARHALGTSTIASRVREAPARLVYREGGAIIIPKKDITKDIRHQAIMRERSRLEEEEKKQREKEAEEAAAAAAASPTPPADAAADTPMPQLRSESTLSAASDMPAAAARGAAAGKKSAGKKKGAQSLMSMWAAKPSQTGPAEVPATPTPAAAAAVPEAAPAATAEAAEAEAEAAPSPPTAAAKPAAKRARAPAKPRAKKEKPAGKEEAKAASSTQPKGRKRTAEERRDGVGESSGFLNDNASSSSEDEMNDDEKRYISDMTIAAALGTGAAPAASSQARVGAGSKRTHDEAADADDIADAEAPAGASQPSEEDASAAATGSPAKRRKVDTPATAFDMLAQAPTKAKRKVRGQGVKSAAVATGAASIEGFAMRGAAEYRNRYERTMVTNESYDADGAMIEEDVWMYKEKATGKLLTEEEYRAAEQAEIQRQNAERKVLEVAKKAAAEEAAVQNRKAAKKKRKEDAAKRRATKRGAAGDDTDSDSIATSDIATEDLSSSEESDDDGGQAAAAPAAKPPAKAASPQAAKRKAAAEPKQAPPAKKPKAKGQSNNLLNYFAKKK